MVDRVEIRNANLLDPFGLMVFLFWVHHGNIELINGENLNLPRIRLSAPEETGLNR